MNSPSWSKVPEAESGNCCGPSASTTSSASRTSRTTSPASPPCAGSALRATSAARRCALSTPTRWQASSAALAELSGVSAGGRILVPPPGGDGPLPPDVPVADLAVAGTYLIPLTDAVRARCHQAAGDTAVADGFYELTRGVARWAQELSRDWMVLYVYCEFWAGDGIHAAGCVDEFAAIGLGRHRWTSEWES